MTVSPPTLQLDHKLDYFAVSLKPMGCSACGSRWSRSLRYLSLYCSKDDQWADQGCRLPGCPCPAGWSRPRRPSAGQEPAPRAGD